MSKVLFINGSPNKDGCCNRAIEEVVNELHKYDIDSEVIWLGKKPVNDCMACFQCIQKGQCVFDDVNEIADKVKDCDGLVVASPVYYGGPNGRLTSMLDRLFFSASSLLQGKFGASIVSCRRSGATAAFTRLNQYFTMSNMNIISSQYWNNVHGSSKEDVEKDLEGLQTMRTLAKNIALYLGKDVTYEKHVFTNFIR